MSRRGLRGRRLGVLVGAAVALVASVGNAGAGAAPLTKDQFVREADTICGETVAATYTIAADTFGLDSAPPTLGELALFADRARPILEQEIDDLRALEEPKRDRKRVRRILAAFEEDLAEAAADPSSALLGSAFADYARLASGYGLQVCGTEAG